ncbi:MULTISPECIES: germination lipoprotein GerS-related protein [Clostridium]|uniref:Germination lipoprotein GerS-related protein n=1 Tax=Clostridium aquiflavi TaxID=3073603 RepID=A0ABU1EK48_9CLOT|nr:MULTISPECIES: germination lipoprotein GerS-related protein [unclassified Clostridium]MDR5588765.1 germination lipoprotein GerS-related protein [Clostridium sp. 5N-1]NFG62787.1 hypothetical protein [Clostridium botulinum]NFQ08045.1 hypothetical protein [Clostridium botulinum]
MEKKKKTIKSKMLLSTLLLIPIITILLIVLFRHILLPTNEDILNYVKNIKEYSTGVEYIFKNSRGEIKELTTQYYSDNKGLRIEFGQDNKTIKVYNSGEIQVKDYQGDEFKLDGNMDVIYPLASINNILSNKMLGEIKENVKEWGDGNYLEIDLKYDMNNKHFEKGKFYIDKKTKSPILLKIFDINGIERVIITYKDFKIEKNLSDELF